MSLEEPRISETPIYDDELFADLEDDFTPNDEDSPIYSPKHEIKDISLEEIKEEPHFSMMPQDLRILETTGLTKRHRFFKVRVKPEFLQRAQDAVQNKMKILVDRYNGDLHVCKVNAKSEICCYFLVSEEVDCQGWCDELKESIEPWLPQGVKPVLLEIRMVK
mmetsp:Transcript_13024/g.24232  ORF Transcript_13024/g.24232 Transcript_13024/m.24232 type:complete len:163 (-) Transcript_13024:550-1038(-)